MRGSGRKVAGALMAAMAMFSSAQPAVQQAQPAVRDALPTGRVRTPGQSIAQIVFDAHRGPSGAVWQARPKARKKGRARWDYRR